MNLINLSKYEKRYLIVTLFIQFAFWYYFWAGAARKDVTSIAVGIGLLLYYYLRLRKSIWNYLQELEKSSITFENGYVVLIGGKAAGQWGR